MNDDDLRRQSERGREAQRLLDHPLIAESVATMTRSAVEEFGETDPGNVVALQVSRLRLQCVKDFVQALRDVVYTGASAEAELKHRERDRNG